MEQAGFNNNDVIAACTILAKKEQNRDELKKAERYLIAFQKSPQSWTISCEILAMDNLSVDVLAQVAIFLKQKFQYDFFQLPQSEYLNMAKLLLRFMVQHFHSSITSQLSLGLVLLYMHTFESLGDLIELLGQSLFTIEKKEGLALDIIKLMPEVSYDKKVIVNNKQRDRYTTFLLNHEAPKVLHILGELSKNQNLGGALKYKILDAFQEWFYFARKDQSLIDNIHDHPCFALALTSMNDSLLAEKARCSINNIIKTVRHPEEHPKIFEVIFNYIFEYMKECDEAIKIDVDHALEYVKVFRAFGIKFSRTMITSPNEGLMKLLQYIIQLTSNQKLYTDVLIELEDFWSEFSNDFIKVLKTNQYPGKIEEFAEVFKLLIQITVTRIQMNQEQLEYIENQARRKKYYENDDDDDDGEDTVDQDLREIEDKVDERRLCRNILLDVQDIIGFSNTFSTIFDTLRELVAKVQENNISWDNLDWDLIAKFECIMYAAKSCINSNKSKERPELSEFFQLVMPIKLKSVKANRTKIELIEYAAEDATMNEEIMSSMFTYLAEHLLEPRTADDAGVALINLCENCSSFVIKNFESFLKLRENFEDNDDLIIGLAVAIAYDQNTPARERYLAQLCTPFAERIVKYMGMWDHEQSETLADNIKANLKKLTMIFGKMPVFGEDETANVNHPLEPVLQELWPIFKNAFKKFYAHTRILVNLCNVIKKCLRTLTVKFKPFLIEYLELIAEIFPLHPLADFLYAIEVSASIFAKSPDMIQPMTKIYEFISSATLTFINDKDMKDHDELIEDFFGLLFRYIKYLPQVVLYSNTLEINLHLAELAIGVDQPNIEKTLFLFLEVLFTLCSYNPKDEVEKALTEIIVNKYGAIYTKKLVKEFTFYPQERLRKYIRDIIFESFIHLKDHTLQWLEMSLSDVSDTILTPAEKEDMLRSLQKIDVNKPKHREDDDESDSDDEYSWSVRDDFKEIFEFFEFRCKLVERRNYKLEKATA